ncbi:MAG TPA: enoyl-CoA hydratase/isomerase family protein [Mycobacteriales bacterium]|jgi:enoyl-CoA hydratase/carnithine racemase|nr:enoyl-CoA hydratase/isomerase family protein [Mycobacteriales bacterium]
MTDYETIGVETDGARATVTLRRPAALNAITPQLLDELGRAFEELGTRADLAVVVLTGEGRAFSAGVDLKVLGDRSIVDGKVGDVLDLPARRVIELITGLPAVVIAKIGGACFTGALELALACDIVVVAEEAKLGDTHARFGLRPTWGMSQRLPWLVGPARARWLSYTARTFTGAQAAQWGLAALACPRAELDGAVEELVAAVLSNSAGSLRAYKDLYRAAERESLPAGLAYEAATEYPIPDSDSRVAGFR